MSIDIEKLSLLGSFASLQQRRNHNGDLRENGFAGKLDEALGEAPSEGMRAGKARELAESLTLQMLQSSLALSGDSPAESAALAGTSQLSATQALLQAYRDNLPKEEPIPSPPVSTQAKLPDSTVDVTATVSTALSRSSGNETWIDPIIVRASQKYGVEAGLIKAVIRAESDFNPQAVSHAGARGLMQLMPATARSLGVSDSFDPEQNVMGGTRFLKDMLQRYNGNVDAALAAYNWGPGNVDRRPDHLPRETRDYLARVKQLYTSYSG